MGLHIQSYGSDLKCENLFLSENETFSFYKDVLQWKPQNYDDLKPEKNDPGRGRFTIMNLWQKMFEPIIISKKEKAYFKISKKFDESTDQFKKIKLSKPLFLAAKSLFKSRGVDFIELQDQNSLRLKIMPIQGVSELNDLAYLLHEQYEDATLIFSPEDLGWSSALATYNPNDHSLNPPSIGILSLESAIGDIRHELAHTLMAKLLRQGIPSPMQGSISVSKEGYVTFPNESFDEWLGYLASMKTLSENVMSSNSQLDFEALEKFKFYGYMIFNLAQQTIGATEGFFRLTGNNIRTMIHHLEPSMSGKNRAEVSLHYFDYETRIDFNINLVLLSKEPFADSLSPRDQETLRKNLELLQQESTELLSLKANFENAIVQRDKNGILLNIKKIESIVTNYLEFPLDPYRD
jgi:hypothetical protein